MHPLLEVRHGTQFTGETNLANRNCSLRKCAVKKRTCHCKRDGKIRCRLRDFEATKRLREHVLIGESQAAMLFEHRDQHCQST